MPDVPIVDAHVHLWDPGRFRMPWLDGNALLNRAFGSSEFARASDGLGIEAVVYVQVDVTPAYGLLEARWAAAQGTLVAGIVAYAPIEDGATARTYLEALLQIDPRIKGVRRLIQSEADPEFQREFRYYLREFCGRPTPLYLAERLTAKLGGAKIYLKREDLLHTGAHKINNCIGQILLARRMG